MPFPEKLKVEMRKRCFHKCCLCQAIGVEIHHIIPQEAGGENTFDNAAPLCGHCHNTYGANPEKRKMIREARDNWLEQCKIQYDSESPRLQEMHERLARLESQLDMSAEKITVKNSENTDEDASKPERKSEDFEKVVTICTAEQTDNSKEKLRSIFYKTTDLYAQVNAINGLLQWFDPMEDAIEDMLAWCDRGIAIVREIEDKGHEARFRAHKGCFLSHLYTKTDMEMFSVIQGGLVIGVQTVTDTEKQNAIKKLRGLEDSFVGEFNAALKIMEEVSDLDLWGDVLLHIGNAAGQRAFHFKTTGLQDSAQKEKRIAIDTWLVAKDSYTRNGNELSASYVLLDMANTLRLLDEPTEAMELLQTVSKTAEKFGDFRLAQGARVLTERVTTGKVPDYVNGERGERKK